VLHDNFSCFVVASAKAVAKQEFVIFPLIVQTPPAVQIAAPSEFEQLLRLNKSCRAHSAAWFNALSESFFATLDKELIADEVWSNHKQARPRLPNT